MSKHSARYQGEPYRERCVKPLHQNSCVSADAAKELAINAPVELVRLAHRVSTPWQNNAGLTAEIAIDDSPTPRWRVSIAELGVAESQFSPFPRRRRIFTVIGEHGVSFDIAGTTVDIAPLHPFEFDGAAAPTCTPKGPASAFNVVADSSIDASVVVHVLRDNTFRTDPSAVTVTYVHSGYVEVATDVGAETCTGGDCIVVDSAAVEISGAGGAHIIVAEILTRKR